MRSKLETVVQENLSLSDQLQAEMKKNSSAGAFVKSLNNNMKQQLDAAIQVCSVRLKILDIQNKKIENDFFSSKIDRKEILQLICGRQL